MSNPSNINKALAWAVHVFTASGLVAGFMALLSIHNGDWRTAMFWLICAGFIDGVDGTFARMVKVKEVLPNVNGNTIDTVVDFVNYAVVPAYLLFSAEVFHDFMGIPMVAIILITSAIYYGKEGMVSDDMYFIGFPVLWNILAFFIIFVFSANEILNSIIIVVFAVLHFVPLKFAYPSRSTKFQKLDLIFCLILLCSMIAIVYLFPSKHLVLSIIASACPVYFMGMAIYNTYLK